MILIVQVIYYDETTVAKYKIYQISDESPVQLLLDHVIHAAHSIVASKRG